jgi:hypothetical protein
MKNKDKEDEATKTEDEKNAKPIIRKFEVD